MTEPEVLVDVRNTTALITLNSTRRRNVLSASMVKALAAAFDDVEARAEVRCVVLTGAGSAFCAGAELDTLERAASGDFGPVRAVYDGFLRVLESPLPSIAAVNGPAVGAGMNLALACDVRLAATGARFDTRFSALNLHPGGGHTWLLTLAVGTQQARMACLFGEVWNANQAFERGLVVSVHEASELLEAALSLADRLGTRDGQFVRRVTASLREAASGASHARLLDVETEAQKWSMQQPAFRAGLQQIRARIAAAPIPPNSTH